MIQVFPPRPCSPGKKQQVVCIAGPVTVTGIIVGLEAKGPSAELTLTDSRHSESPRDVTRPGRPTTITTNTTLKAVPVCSVCGCPAAPCSQTWLTFLPGLVNWRLCVERTLWYMKKRVISDLTLPSADFLFADAPFGIVCLFVCFLLHLWVCAVLSSLKKSSFWGKLYYQKHWIFFKRSGVDINYSLFSILWR